MLRQILLISVLAGYLTATAYDVNGYVFDINKEGIGDAKVSLMRNDSIVAFAFSDSNGLYSIEQLESGEYQMVADKTGYLPFSFPFELKGDQDGLNIMLRNDPEYIQEEGKDLDELVVTPEMFQSFGDHDVMYLSKENRDHGVNALDAISSLPKFLPTVNGSSLTDLYNHHVAIFINGRKSTAEEIRNLSGKDIAKVEYYPTIPMKYASSIAGSSMINITLQKPKDLKISTGINLSSALLCKKINGSVNFTLMTPKSYLMVGYYPGYSDNNNRETTQTFDYGDLVNIYDSNSDKRREMSNTLYGIYQWNSERDMFALQFSYASNWHKTFTPSVLTVMNNDERMDIGEKKESFNDHSDNLAADIYYSHQFNHGNELSLNLVGSLIKSGNHSHLLQFEGNTEQTEQSFEFSTDTKNRLYSFIAEALYSHPLFGGEASIRISDHFRKLRQDYYNGFLTSNSSLNRNSDNTLFAGISYNRAFGKLFGSAELTLFCNSTKAPENIRTNSTQLLPRINLNYRWNNSMSTRLMLWMQSSRRTMGSTNDNLTYLDTHYFAQNNIDPRDVFTYAASLSSDFQIAGGKLFISPFITYRYTHRPEMSVVYFDGGNYIKKDTQMPLLNDISYQLSARWSIIPGLTFMPALLGNYTAYNTSAARHRHNNLQTRLILDWSISKFQIGASATSPATSYSGDAKMHEGWKTEVYGYWKHRGFYAGLSFFYGYQDHYIETSSGKFKTIIHSKDRDYRDMLRISLGYTFDVGRSFNSNYKGKRLNNRESETGF